MASADGPASQPAKEKLLLVDACVQRFEKAWQSGRPAIDDFLPRDGSDRLAVLKELVRVDIERRLADGEPARAEDYLERYPELAAYLHPTQVVESTPQQPVNAGRAALPQQIGRYRVEKILGQGGFGVVYLAHDDQLSRPVAIKVPHAKLVAGPEDAKPYLTEARIVAGLDHPNIVPVYDVGNTEDCPFFVVSKFIEGSTLARRITENRPSVLEATELVARVAETLHYAHKKGLVHRDIKPGNILLEWHGDNQPAVPYVADFGLALREADFGKGAGITGTPAYLSPEQARGESHRVDGRSDIFSLGVVFYELLTGRRPFHADSVGELLDQIKSVDARPPRQKNDAIPRELERICLKALSKQVSDRYTTAKDMADDLRHFLEQSTEAEKLVLRSTIPAAAPPSRAPRRPLRRVIWVAAALVALALFAGLFAVFRGRGEAIDLLAVLPLANEGGDAGDDYISDGITESITTRLAQVRALRVLPRSAVSRYRGRAIDARAAGAALGVKAVLTGRVGRRGPDVLVTVELIHVGDNYLLWSEQYQRKLEDGIAAEIAKEIAEKLRLRLTENEQERLAKRNTDNPQAYERYLKGRYCWNHKTFDRLKQGINYFKEALESDPDFALAYTGLADSYNSLGYWGILRPGDAFLRARHAAEQALRKDDLLAEAHVSLGLVELHYNWDWLVAEKEFRRAIALNPNLANAHHWYSHCLTALGRTRESLTESMLALKLDPLTPDITVHLAWHYYYARQYEDAIRQARVARDLEPLRWASHLFLALPCSQMGQHREAVAEAEQALAFSPDLPFLRATLGYAYAASDNKTAARKLLVELIELLEQKEKYVAAYDMAVVYTGLGEKDKAFEWLRKACVEKCSHLILLGVEPMFDGLRSDSRFGDLLRDIGLPASLNR